MNISELLNTTLEIEGLIRILQSRYDSEVHDLLTEKVDRLSILAHGLENEDVALPVEEEEDALILPEKPEETALVTDPNDFANAFTTAEKEHFTRELFHNNPELFNSTLSIIKNLGGLGKAYDYLLNDLEWDADREVVSEFLGIVASHFNSAS